MNARRLVNERVCADEMGLTVGWLRRDRTGKQLVPFYRLSRKTVRYDLVHVRDALDKLEHGAVNLDRIPAEPDDDQDDVERIREAINLGHRGVWSDQFP
jgi:hypothetical protein